MFHCNGWGMVFALTGMGGRHVMLRKVDGPEILRRIDQHDVTFLGGAPAVVNMILDAAGQLDGPVASRDRVRMLIGGAPPPSRTFERMETELGWEPIQIYGLTETSPLLTLNRRRQEWDGLSPAQRAQQLIRAGAPALGVRLAIAPDGEVITRSNVVFDGYWRQPEATAEAMAGGWFHTGDGGHLDAEGYVTISDRKKDVIISGGENVSSIEVEDCLFQHPAVAEAAVIGVPDERWGETVKAIVVLKPGTAVDEADLIAHCRGLMAHFKCPSTVEIRDELARTVTGKVQKFKLRAPYWEGRTRMVS
jgi:acyl-CoA synthetase (AMP-forming)/AMP-acid ligase II